MTADLRNLGLAIILCVFTGLPGNTAEKYDPKGGPVSGAPIILCHPQDQVIHEKGKAEFRVEADYPPPQGGSPISYQWQRQGPWATNYVNVPGATNDTFTINSVSTNDVAYYRVQVSSTNSVESSYPAQLIVFTHNSPLTLYGSPYPSNVPTGNCPAPYIAYVNYKKTVADGWGWAPDHAVGNTHSATDNNFTDTKILVQGITNDSICQPTTVANTHAGAPSPEDTKYRFTVYFTVSHSSPNPYPLILDGFR